jgi:hypothetical protein
MERPVLQNQSTPEPSPLWSFPVALDGQITTGLFDKVAAGAGASVGVAYKRWIALALVGHTWASQSVPIAATDHGSVLVRLSSLGLRACGLHDFAAARVIDLSACVGPEIGKLRASGRGVHGKSDGGALWTAAVASLGASFHLTRRLTWQNRGEVGLGITRPDVGIMEQDGEWQSVTRPDRLLLSFAASLGIEL